MVCVQTVTIITTSPSFYPTLHNLLDILYHINGSPKSSDRKEFHTLTMAWFKSTLNMGLKNLYEIRHTYRHTRWWHTIPTFVGRYRVHIQIALPYSKGHWIGQKQAHTNLDNVEYLKNHLAPEPEQNHKDIYQEDMDFSTYILEGLPKNDKTCVSQNPFMGGFSSFGILLYIYSSAQKSKKLP